MIDLRGVLKKVNKGSSAEEAGATTEKPKKKKWSKKRKIITGVAVIVVAALLFNFFGNKKKTTTTSYSTVTVERRTIIQTLSGSGTLQPAASYIVTTLVTGEVLNAPIKEGDKVKKGDLLYSIDSTDIASTINRAKITLTNAQNSYSTKLKNMDNLNVKSPIAGTVTNVAVEVGDEIKAGATVATIVDSATMTLVIPFPSDDAVRFYVGQSATVILDGSFEKITGTISKVAATDSVLTGNIMARYVTIDVKNPGAISNTQSASASIGGAAGCSSAVFAYKNTATITSLVAGTVSNISAPEGTRVSKNQAVVVLTSDTMTNDLQNSYNSVQDAQLALENNSTKMENYNIVSPIDGTIVLKNYKQGDNLYDTGLRLCVVYDLSYLQVTMSVDELDITNVKVGQNATLTADAVAGKTFNGTVTKVSTVGTTTNGVTTYPVTIQIDDFTGLLPSMNVSAKILVNKSENVLSVPLIAVSRGNRLLVKNEGVQVTPGAAITAETGKTPEGYTSVNITTGLKDSSFIEVKTGLKEGDIIAYAKPVTSATSGGLFAAPPRTPAPSVAPTQNRTVAGPGGTGGTVGR